MKSQRNLHVSFRGSNALPGRPFRLAALAMAALLVTGQIHAQNITASAGDTSSNSSSAEPVQAAAAPLPAAPTAVQQEARLTDPVPDLSLTLARQNANQNMVSTPEQPKHHALAATGAILGTVVLLVGVGSLALSTKCHNSNCTSVFRNGGIGLTAGGGAMAGAGYYFWFRK